jgi:Prolyl oligopeptidase family
VWLVIVLLCAIPPLALFLYLRPSLDFLRSLRKGANNIRIDSRKNRFQFDIYPGHDEVTSTLLVVPGLHPNGIYDPRFRAFAQTCANTGFYVVAPDLEDFRNVKVTLDSSRQLVGVLNEMTQHVPAKAQKNIGVLGISYGAGPVFVAAGNPELRTRVDFLISVGGYYDFAHFLHFVVRGVHESNGDIHARKSQEWARMIFAINYLQHFNVSEQEQIREVLWLLINSRYDEAAQGMGSLSTASQQFINEVRGGFSEENLQTFHTIMARDRQSHADLSPSCVLERLNPEMRFYLLHGKTDDLVPYEETEELAHALRATGHKNIYSLTTASLTHVDLKEPEDLKGAAAMLFWVRRVLSEVKK